MTSPFPTVDPLGEALHSVRMSGVFYSRCEFTAPWALALPIFEGCLMFHVVTEGACWIEAGGSAGRELRRGQFALVPHGEGHRMGSDLTIRATRLFDLPREQLGDRYELLRMGGGGEPTGLVCGAVHFDDPAARHLVSLLPRLIAIEAWTSPERDWIESTLRLVASEARALRPGGDTVITRLADILVVQATRAWMTCDPAANRGWVGALQDARIGRAIAMIHRDPVRAWTVASLATEVAMSRSAFAARFTHLVGEPVMRYVARWRMHTARAWLKAEGTRVAEVASRLGYESESAFSRAFKRVFGIAPGGIRRTEAGWGGSPIDPSSPNVEYPPDPSANV